MKILFLGYGKNETSLIDFLEDRGHLLKNTSSKVNNFSDYDLVISFGYRHIIKDTELKSLKRPIINLHVSFLPFNRGSHPNFWSHFENTPSGVSIHEIDSGIDTGPIIFRKRIEFNDPQITLDASYKKLKFEIEKLFKKNINSLELREYKSIFTKEKGTYHNKSDLPEWVRWDMTIEEVNRNQCYVVLGHLMSADGELGDESKSRVLKLVECIQSKPGQLIFFCGWDYRDDSQIKLASALRDFFLKHVNEVHNIILSDTSRDTVGDAVLLKYNFGDQIKEKNINLITSDYHMLRAKKIFEFVFSKNNIILQPATIGNTKDLISHETKSIEIFEKTFKGIRPGEINEIYERLVFSHPYYNGTIHSKIE